MPNLSVIIPVYGVEKYIERCARSLFEQTLDDIEYLFIDDCTPDKSIEILKSVVEEYPNRKSSVIIHRMEQNSGQAAVRKWGILHASGDYIIHCDSDDWVNVEMYKKLYEKAIEGDYDMVRCNFVRTDGKKQKLCKQIPNICYENPEKLISLALSGNDLTSTWDKMFKRALYYQDIVFPTCNMQEDAAYVVQLLFYCRKCAFVPIVGYYYFVNPNSITHTLSESSYLNRMNDVLANGCLIYCFLEKKNMSERFAEEIVAHKLATRNHILNIVDKWKYFILWNKTYPEIKGKVLLNPVVSRIDKIYYILIRLGMFPILLSLYKKIKRR